MDQNIVRSDVLPETLSPWLLAALAAFGVAAWVLCHWAVKRFGSNKFNVWCRAALSLPAGMIACWLVLQFASRFVFLQTPWPLILLAVVGAVSFEAVSAFYSHECARIPPRTARALVALRMGAVAAVLFVLSQPVVIGDRERTFRQRVLVLVDDSASMHFKDGLMTEEERGDAAKALGLDSLPETTRGEIVSKLLTEGGGKKFLDRIAAKYTLDVFRFGSGLQREEDIGADKPLDAKEKSFRSATDMTRALELALEDVPAEEIVSVLIFTDGRHNGDAGVDSVARRLGSYGITVSSVLIGGTTRPFDLAVASADAPESVFLGDKVRLSVRVTASRANGRKAKLTLSRLAGEAAGEEEVESKDVAVEGDDWSGEFRFTDLPKEKGVYRYRVSLTRSEGEMFDDNNERVVDVAVSDDRTNVLLVDGRPRWEYRYLRNLFYGRDKSVHLQDWIVHPDTIAGVTPDPLPPASADRPFGESEADGFPMTLDDWRKFDVIIIGDIGADVLSDHELERIRHCVEERGALLVIISGSEYMPCSFSSQILRDIIPVEVDVSSESRRDAPENDFRFTLAPAGRAHEVMSQSSSAFESEEIWNDMPLFHWRLPVNSVKPGGEVLAYASPSEDASAVDVSAIAESLAASVEDDPEAAIRQLAEMREKQDRNALVVAASRGKGRVLMLLTDSMWRLRTKSGDHMHHRFWGQVMRWGAGERLRAGNKNVRLGTDQLRYGAGEKVKVCAKFLDWEFKGISGLSPRVMVKAPGEGRAKTMTLEERTDGNGFYSCELDDCLTPGEYMLKLLECDKAKSILSEIYPKSVETSFVVVTAKRPAEDVDVTATREYVERIAKATSGRVLTPSEFVSVEDDWGGGSKSVAERVEHRLWSLPPLFLLAVALLTAEWIIRKKATLA